jgi:hypothetical protein
LTGPGLSKVRSWTMDEFNDEIFDDEWPDTPPEDLSEDEREAERAEADALYDSLSDEEEDELQRLAGHANRLSRRLGTTGRWKRPPRSVARLMADGERAAARKILVEILEDLERLLLALDELV